MVTHENVFFRMSCITSVLLPFYFLFYFLFLLPFLFPFHFLFTSFLFHRCRGGRQKEVKRKYKGSKMEVMQDIRKKHIFVCDHEFTSVLLPFTSFLLLVYFLFTSFLLPIYFLFISPLQGRAAKGSEKEVKRK